MKCNKAIINTYRCVDGNYWYYPYGWLNGRTYENVDVRFKKEIQTVDGVDINIDVIKIKGVEPIECKLIGYKKFPDGFLMIEVEDEFED